MTTQHSTSPTNRTGRTLLKRTTAAATAALSLAAVAAAPPTPPAGPDTRPAIFSQQPASQPPPPAPAPVAPPPAAARAGVQSKDEKVATLLKFLETDAYGKKLAAPYWVSRAMGVVSMARLPQAGATDRLMEVLEKDKHDVVRLLAWQAVLARAPEMDAALHKRWSAATLALAEKGAFRGRLRVALLDALAVAPPSAKSKRVWQGIFTEANAWEPQDVPVLDALGRTLAAWKSPALVDALIKGMADPNAGVRADYVLHAAGCDVPLARDTLDPAVLDPLAANRKHLSSVDLWRKQQATAASWFAGKKAEWKEVTKVDGEPWKGLPPLWVAPPVPVDAVDPADPLWTADLEIGRADLGAIEAAFVVDATGSMGDVLAWLKRDVARVMSAFAAVSKEAPKVGVVFYRDRDASTQFVTQVLPMTFRLQDLEPKLSKMTADGGGDIPEAVLEGLRAAVDGMAWSAPRKAPPTKPTGAAALTATGVGKVVLLVGDAPPKPGTEAECAAAAKRAMEKGIKTFAVKVTTADGRNDLTAFEAIAAAGGGSTVEATFNRLIPFRYLMPDGSEQPPKTVARPEVQLVVAPAAVDLLPGDKILVHVLSDLISPQYRDRVEPLAQTLLAHVSVGEPEKRLPFTANTPSLNEQKFNAQKK